MSGRLWVLVCTAFVVACGGGSTPVPSGGGDGGGGGGDLPPPVTQARVEITPLQTSPTAGQFVQLTASAYDAQGKLIVWPQWRWSTSDAAVAQVTEKGLLMATGGGTASVSASTGNLSGSLTVTISPREIPAGQLLVQLGPMETVYDWDTQRCDDVDWPDLPPHAVRRADGSLLLISGSAPLNRSFEGPDFDHLQHRCAPVLASQDDPTPQSHRNGEWISSIWRAGDVVHALIHNEFHDPFAPACEGGDGNPGTQCWYNSITAMRSTDGGRSFAPPQGASHLVAPAPLRWDPTNAQARIMQGYFTPSNVVTGPDGFLYAVFMAMPDPADLSNSGMCVMRTDDIADPGSWRAWDGSGFTVAMRNPYDAEGPVPACRAVLPEVSQPTLTFNEYVQQFMVMDMRSDYSTGALQCGIYYALSSDLVHWSTPQRIEPAYAPPWTGVCTPPPGEAGGMAYVSVIDHTSASVNFETAGQTAYLYYMRTSSPTSQAPRDLVRRPMILLKGPGAVAARQAANAPRQ